MDKYWETTVTELLKNFREAIIALIPYLEKASVRWKDDEQYDGYFNIATSLFNNMICANIFSEVGDEYPIANYDIIYNSYLDLNYISIVSKKYPDINLAFIGFNSLNSPLDTIYAAVLDNEFNVSENIEIEEKNLEYRFIKNDKGKIEIINDIRVLL